MQLPHDVELRSLQRQSDVFPGSAEHFEMRDGPQQLGSDSAHDGGEAIASRASSDVEAFR